MSEQDGREPVKGDNQNTTPPMTPARAMTRLRKELLRAPKKRVRQADYDWATLAVEWSHSSKSDFPNLASWCKTKGIHPGSLQKRGGRTLWYELRDSVHARAIEKIIERAPDKVAKQYESGLEFVDLLKTVGKKYAKRLLMDPEKPIKPGKDATAEQKKEYEDAFKEYKRQLRQVPADAIKTLAEAADALNDTTQRLFGDTNAKNKGGPTVNLYQEFLGSIQDRDKQFGVVDEPGE